MSDEADTQGAAVLEAVRSALPGEYVTKTIVLAETINADGERTLLVAGEDDLMPWELLGLAEYLRLLARETVGYEDDDED